jgi:ubiquitin-conjugating enzyme E2 variant
MSSTPKLKMQSADDLAKGYPGWFRYVEIGSITSFWALMALMVYRVWPHAGARPWVVFSALLVGFLAADFTSGFVHWLADTWGRVTMPVIGKALLRPFREHHVDPKAMTHHDYVETNGANCMISVPWAIGAAAMPYDPSSSWYAWSLFFSVSIASMIFFVMMTNQIHKWSHQDDIPRIVVWLQRAHLILPPEHHQIHHTAPYNKYYSITTGWLNWPLTKLHFYPLLERFGTAVFGAIPRQDDIGTDAALAIAPLTPETGGVAPDAQADQAH